ncbi:putative membrane protein [Methanosarcina siciliae HI350]|uniref:Putative membrane protein n=1 Tax=Methanosarcina siciliae HI350 TaxID=1434119 RepID=A0A0E3LAZ6_9EURY|nr:putative membrane protein [Methanosarcina siciliae HI350]
MIEDLSKQQLITLQDAAIVSWPMGKKKPKTKQLTSMTGVGALSGAFWGMLFGLIFLVPIFGMVVGAAIGALSASFADVGISDDFIKSVRSKVTEGTSALFLLTSDAVQDKVVEATRGMKFELIASNLSQEEEDKLREVFAEEEAAAPAH